MAMAVPAVMLAASLIKSKMDSDAAQSQDAAMRQAGAQKLAAMRQGAGQMEAYRQSLSPQMLAAMQNRMQTYAPAQNVLSQMYGGGRGGGAPAPGFSPGMRPMGMGGPMGQTAFGRPGMPMPSQLAGAPYQGPPPRMGMGFGGEMPMPMSLNRRTI